MPKQLKRFERDIAKARAKDSLRASGRLTEMVDGTPRIIRDAPLIVTIEDLLPALAAERPPARCSCQRLMQAAGDIMLGWFKTTGLDGVERDFYIRQLWGQVLRARRVDGAFAEAYADQNEVDHAAFAAPSTAAGSRPRKGYEHAPRELSGLLAAPAWWRDLGGTDRRALRRRR
jgi:hypothetical protein